MKKILSIFVLLFSMSFVIIPAKANRSENENKYNYSGGNSLANQTRTRYVRVRGKRYRVTYKLFRRNGRLYYRIINYRRA